MAESWDKANTEVVSELLSQNTLEVHRSPLQNAETRKTPIELNLLTQSIFCLLCIGVPFASIYCVFSTSLSLSAYLIFSIFCMFFSLLLVCHKTARNIKKALASLVALWAFSVHFSILLLCLVSSLALLKGFDVHFPFCIYVTSSSAVL